MWLPDPAQTNTIKALFTDVFSTIVDLIGSLSVWNLPKRLLDTSSIMLVSIGVVAIVPLVYYFRKTKWWRNPLLWLILVPIILFIGERDMNTFDYTMVAMPFISLAICYGLAKMNGKMLKVFQYATLITVLGFGIFNVQYFDIGRTLDKNLGATQLYRVEFEKLPNDSIFMPNYAWEWEAIYKYNADTGKKIYPICVDILPSETYQEALIQDGIKLTPSKAENISIKASEIAKSIVALNDNVWTTISTDPKTFTSKVVETNHNSDLVANVDKEKIQQQIDNPQILWKPFNPYSIMTTELFITDWGYIQGSNRNVRNTMYIFIVLLAVVYCINKLHLRKSEKYNTMVDILSEHYGWFITLGIVVVLFIFKILNVPYISNFVKYVMSIFQ
jgi:hypothetical protein